MILHADMDAFFAAIEQREHPELRGLPVVVGGTSGRGVVSTASYEARRFGIHSAMPTAHARKLCPHAVFIPGSMATYRRESARVFEIFRRFTPLVESASLDEAFLDIDGCERLWGPPEALARELRAVVARETGLAVSVGGGPVKLVAKIASDVAKPDGLRIVAPAEVAAFLGPLPVGRLWGLGPKAQQRLATAGITTIGQLLQRSEAQLRPWLGSAAAHMLALARGEDGRHVDPDRARKSYGEESTFESDVSDLERLRSAIRRHADAVATRLRRDSMRARGVTLKLKLARPLGQGRFPLVTRSITLRRATDDGRALGRIAERLLERSGVREPVRLVGVAATRLEAAQAGSLDLFAPVEEARRTRLNRTLDAIRSRFGVEAVQLGGDDPEAPAIADPSRLTLTPRD